MSRTPLIFFISVLTCACHSPSNSSDGTAVSEGERADAGSERARTGYEQSLERAREVEEQAREAGEEKRRRIEEDTGGGRHQIPE